MAEKRIADKYDRDFLLKLLEEMVIIRRVEEKAAQMYGLQKIGGFLHPVSYTHLDVYKRQRSE